MEEPLDVIIVDYDSGNVKSLIFALQKIGVNPLLTDDHKLIQQATHIIFPGQGHVETAMNNLRERGLDTIIPSLTQPFLGICVGMQIMCHSSAEADTSCLGILPTKVQKFTPVSSQDKVPHMGWNELKHTISSSPLLSQLSSQAYVYYVHSYYVPLGDYTISKTKYADKEFSGIVKKGNFYGCQFHPEKSGEVGLTLLRNFLQI